MKVPNKVSWQRVTQNVIAVILIAVGAFWTSQVPWFSFFKDISSQDPFSGLMLFVYIPAPLILIGGILMLSIFKRRRDEGTRSVRPPQKLTVFDVCGAILFLAGYILWDNESLFSMLPSSIGVGVVVVCLLGGVIPVIRIGRLLRSRRTPSGERALDEQPYVARSLGFSLLGVAGVILFVPFGLLALFAGVPIIVMVIAEPGFARELLTYADQNPLLSLIALLLFLGVLAIPVLRAYLWIQHYRHLPRERSNGDSWALARKIIVLAIIVSAVLGAAGYFLAIGLSVKEGVRSVSGGTLLDRYERDPNMCGGLLAVSEQGQWQRAECYTDLAEVMMDAQFCSLIGNGKGEWAEVAVRGQKHLCFQRIASLLKDERVCHGIPADAPAFTLCKQTMSDYAKGPFLRCGTLASVSSGYRFSVPDEGVSFPLETEEPACVIDENVMVYMQHSATGTLSLYRYARENNDLSQAKPLHATAASLTANAFGEKRGGVVALLQGTCVTGYYDMFSNAYRKNWEACSGVDRTAGISSVSEDSAASVHFSVQAVHPFDACLGLEAYRSRPWFPSYDRESARVLGAAMVEVREMCTSDEYAIAIVRVGQQTSVIRFDLETRIAEKARMNTPIDINKFGKRKNEFIPVQLDSCIAGQYNILENSVIIEQECPT